MARFIITEWTVNPEEEKLGGLSIGKLATVVVDNAEDASFQLGQSAQDCGVDDDQAMEAQQYLELEGRLPEDGLTLDNDEGHYINIQMLPEERRRRKQ